MPIKFLFLNIIVIIFLFSILSCSDENITQPARTYERGEIIESGIQNTFSVNDIELAVSLAGITDELDLQHSVQAVTIIYQTIDADGIPIEASGALMVPVSDNSFPLLSIQHGTETRRNYVASVSPLNSVEGVSGLITGSIGYVTCIPDYPGLGTSKIMHPYMHAKSLTTSVIDFLVAVKDYCSTKNTSLNGKLFLGGYSEGGYVTLATQKEIEENYSSLFNITAVAPMAGPHDLFGTAELILNQPDYKSPAYIAFLLTAYNDVYEWGRLDEIFLEPYAGMMTQLFDGTNSFSEINSALPTNPSLLLESSFIIGFNNKTDTTLISAFQENTLLDWSPVAPIRFFHGDADDTVPFQNSILARDSLLSNGATQIELITIPGGTHSTAGLPAVLGMIDWFESFRLLP